jgi:PAS domain S-box-containing protein
MELMTESSFRKLLLRFALVPVLALAAFVGLLGLQLHEITVRRAEASRATAILLQSEMLQKSMIDEETGIRGYLVSKDPAFLQPYSEASVRFLAELGELSSLASTSPSSTSPSSTNASSASPSESARVNAIVDSFKSFDSINHALLNADPANDGVTTLLKAQKQAMDRLRAELAGLIAEQNNLREAGRNQINELFSRLPWLAIGGAMLVALVMIWHGVSLFGRITRAFREQLNETVIQRDALHTTLRSIGDAVVVCDNKGNITLLNPTAEEVTGWTEDEAVGKPLDKIFRIINEYNRKTVESPVAKVLALGQVVGLANHTLLIRRDGTEVSIDDSGAPVRDRKGDIVGVVLVFRDIEARRKAERELELRTAELESMLFHSPAGFASIDRQYRFVRVNRAMAEINGVPAEEHLGRTLRDIVPTNAPFVEPIVDLVFSQKTPVQQAIVGETLREPGVERQWLTCFYPVLTSNGHGPAAVGAIVLETTDQKRAQESSMRSEKLAVVGRLAASIAHEMNNPLESVTNLLYLIAQDEAIRGESREFVDRAGIELSRVSKIATQTLRFAMRSMAPTLVDLEEIVDGVLLLFNGRITLNRVKVIKRVEGRPRYFGHSNEIMQLLTNLMSNALDAIPPDGCVVVSIRSTRNWRTQNEGVSITMADTGSGIPADLLEKVWEPFYTTKPATGTGLGLWLVDEMVKKNDGTVRFRTSSRPPRRGTTFRIFLPNLAPPETQSRQPTESTA